MKTILLFMKATFAMIAIAGLVAAVGYYYAGDITAFEDSRTLSLSGLIGFFTFHMIERYGEDN